MKQWLRYVSWLLPHGVHVWRRHMLSRAAAPDLLPKGVLASNASLKNRHQGQRCFILGNGPSAKQLDLRSLQGETVFSVSNGYLHRDYAAMSPAYHCVPQITYGKMTEADVIAWFCEMNERIGDAELFLNETEAALVSRYQLFPGRQIHYLAFRESFDELRERRILDLAQPAPRVESVPVMGIMIALYMGFDEIVLLGVDHDHFKTGHYVYAFEPQIQKDKDYSVKADGQIVTSRHDDFQSLARLWRQYRVLHEIARTNGRSILNATPAGELDEFPRANLQSLLKARHEDF